MVEIIKTGFMFLSIIALILSALLIVEDLFLLALLDVLVLLLIVVLAMVYHKDKVRVVTKEVIYERKIPVVRKVYVTKKVPVIKKVYVTRKVTKKVLVKKSARRTRFLGHSVNKVYHKLRCRWGKRIAHTNKIKFVSENQARRKKYHRCPSCF